MKRTLQVQGEAFPLITPFRISRGIKTVAEVVTVKLTQDGLAGRGECVPYPRYGETVESTIAAIEAARDALEQGAGREDVLRIMPAGAARNAVDCAIWDLEMHTSGTNVAAYLGMEPIGPTPTAITIGLDTPSAMGAAARTLAHVPLIKVKVDRNDPSSQLRAVRAAAPDPRLIVDPNESWTIEDVQRLQELMIELKVDLLEQPLPTGQDEALCGFTPSVPIAADESVHVVDDLAHLVDRYQVVNIKLDKAGGLTAALKLADEGSRQGMAIMTGCMICSSLSIAPALILAARSRFVDLDGPLWLSCDREGGVTGADGILSPPAPGFWGAR